MSAPASPGLMASPTGARVDFTRLRAARRTRLLRAMEEHGLDVLVLGRPAAVAYATGAQQLWTAGTRPFSPACIVVRATGRTHLLSTWDEGVPAELSHDDLFGLSWNPAKIASTLASVPGLRDARTVGTDSSSPGARQLLERLAPGATLVDGRPALRAAASGRTEDELRAVVAATAVAEAGLAAMVDVLRPGVTERQLLGAYLARIATLGAPTPPTEGVACATPRTGPVHLRRFATARPVGPGELVVLDSGALFAGYEGGVGRTWLPGPSSPTLRQRELGRRCADLLDAVVDACRAGATGVAVRDAWERTGEALPPWPFVHGVGLGAEPPVIGASLGAGEVLVPGTILSVTAWVAAEGAGGFLERELVLVGDGAPAVLSRFGRGPAGREGAR